VAYREADLRAARRDLRRLTEQVKRNEEKLKKSQERELRLLNAPDLETLFTELGPGLAQSYSLRTASVVLADPEHAVRHLLHAAGTPADGIEGLMLVETLTGLAPQYLTLNRPWLGAYHASDHARILPGLGSEGSVAMIPLKTRDRLVGSLNFGSADPQRFTRELASDILRHLGVMAAFAIENGVNRARLLKSGFTDVLTGWHNRRYLVERLREELARARRDATHLACLILDIDHFKRVNDTWGHAAGDTVLTELARRIEGQVRQSDVAARYGGEEFVVLMPGTDTDSAVPLAERIRCAIAASPVELPGAESVMITASIGIASVEPALGNTEPEALGEQLLERADKALYRAKSTGRDRVEVGA
jgi:two-component system cell cycle response regulator